MHLKSSLLAIVASATLVGAIPSFAQHEHHAPAKPEAAAPAGKLIRVTEKDAAWAAKARETYPLGVCPVSGDKLGNMGKAPEYIYRVEGQPDRLVVFCCSGCEEDFMSDPAKYLARIDVAAKARDGADGAHAGTGHHH